MNDLETIKNRFPGISCAYRDAAGKVTTKCFGFADKEANVPVDENTAFPACSISKFITAICVIFRRFSGLQMHKSTCDFASRVQLYRKPRKKPPFRYTVELWCIENHEEYPVFDTNSLFCMANFQVKCNHSK